MIPSYRDPYVANEAGGIALILDQDDDELTVIADPGTDLHTMAQSGDFGTVADYDVDRGLNIERAGMTVHRRAMLQILSDLPVSESPTLAAAFPAASHLREAIDSYVATLPVYDPLRDIWEQVVEFIRLHPDFDMVTTALGFEPWQADQFFREAMKLEAAYEAGLTTQ